MNAAARHSYLISAMRRALRPVARLLIRAGIRFDEFSAIAKNVYVESCIRGSESPKPASRRRIAVITGLTGKEVDYYIDSDGALIEVTPTSRTTLVEILHKWHTVPEYAGPYGIPRELDFESPSDRCFCSLVRLVDPKADAQAILRELLTSGAVARAGHSHLRAVSRFLMVPDSMSREMIEHYGDRISRLATTIEHNLNPNHTEKRLERRVVSDRGLPSSLLPAFENYARGKAVDFLLELDNWVSTQTGTTASGPEGEERVGTGVNVFLYANPIPSAAEREHGPNDGEPG